jgi:hypothetical protein
MAIAKGQDHDVRQLLDTALRERGSPSIQLIMPSVCAMEALSVLHRERKQRRRFQDDVNSQLREVTRDDTGVTAAELQRSLMSANIRFGIWQDVVRIRLSQALSDLGRTAIMIDLSAGVLEDSLQTALIDDPTDNLILFSILDHARTAPAGPRAFRSENSDDFGQRDVTRVLENVGVKYFRRTEAALGWLRSQAGG